MKICSRCKESKPLDQFAKCKRAGHQTYCRSCKAAWAKAKYHADIEVSREKVRVHMRKMRAAKPEHMRSYIDRWRAENPERCKKVADRQRAKPERKAYHAVYWPEWKRRNPEAARAIAKRGAALRRERQYANFVEHVDPLEVLNRGRGICHICLKPVDPFKFHVEHVVPISRGGEHSYANTRPSHRSCNAFKRSRLMEELPSDRIEMIRA